MGWVDTTGGWKIVKGQRNTRCIWFPKAEIQNMASIICRNDSLDGVRFYLANYNLKYTDTLPTREYENAPPMVYRNKTTLIMVPTWDSVPKGDTTHYHRDFIVLDSKGKVIKGRTFLRAINPENKGELCPPGDCGPDGALLLLE
ncbi:hypothetical protein [Chitinophaga jiangningensis]|nr:hypothetical protein [Chitinophaga jiangningensis]